MASHLHVLLNVSHVATNGAVDAVLRNDDATFKSKAFTELLLPELYRFRIRERREDVIKDDLGDRWRMLVHATILRQGTPLKNPQASSRFEQEKRGTV